MKQDYFMLSLISTAALTPSFWVAWKLTDSEFLAAIGMWSLIAFMISAFAIITLTIFEE